MAKNRCSHTDARTKHRTNYTRLRSLRFVAPPTNSSKKRLLILRTLSTILFHRWTNRPETFHLKRFEQFRFKRDYAFTSRFCVTAPTSSRNRLSLVTATSAVTDVITVRGTRDGNSNCTRRVSSYEKRICRGRISRWRLNTAYVYTGLFRLYSTYSDNDDARRHCVVRIRDGRKARARRFGIRRDDRSLTFSSIGRAG